MIKATYLPDLSPCTRASCFLLASCERLVIGTWITTWDIFESACSHGGTIISSLHLRRPKPVLLKVWLRCRRGERGKRRTNANETAASSTSIFWTVRASKMEWRALSHPQIQFGHFSDDKKSYFVSLSLSLSSLCLSPPSVSLIIPPLTCNILALAGRPPAAVLVVPHENAR